MQQLAKTVATKSILLPEEATITAAELEAASSMVSFLTKYYQGYDQALEAIQQTTILDYRAVRVLKLADLA